MRPDQVKGGTPTTARTALCVSSIPCIFAGSGAGLVGTSIAALVLLLGKSALSVEERSAGIQAVQSRLTPIMSRFRTTMSHRLAHIRVVTALLSKGGIRAMSRYNGNIVAKWPQFILYRVHQLLMVPTRKIRTANGTIKQDIPYP